MVVCGFPYKNSVKLKHPSLKLMHACYLHYSLFDVQCLSLAKASFRDSLYKINDYTHSQPGHVSLLTLLPFLSRASTLLFSSARHPICTSCIRSVVLKISVSVEVLHIMCVCVEREDMHVSWVVLRISASSCSKTSVLPHS